MYALKFNPEGHGTAGNDEVVFSPSLSVSLGSSTIDWLFEFRIKLDALPTVAGTYYFIGSDTTSSEGIYLRLNAGIYTLAFAVSASLRFQSSADMILADGEFHTYKISRVRNQSNVIFERDGVPFGSPATQANGTAVMDVNRFGRGATNATNFTSFEMDYFICSTSSPVYAEWRADLSGGSGDTLPTTDGSRDGILTNFTTVDADKWINYGGTAATMAASLFSLSSVSSALEANIQLMSTLASVSYISSALTAGATGLAASLQTRSSAAAQATTQVHMADVLSATATATPSLSSQVRFGAQLTGVASMTASIDVPAGNGNIAATLSTRSSLYATLLEQIQLATLAKSSATLTATIAGSAARMAAQLKNKSAVYSSFQAYKQVSFDVIGIPDGSYHTFVRDHITHQVLYDADAVYSAQQLTLYVNAQSGDKVSGYVIDRLNPAENGAVLYGLVS